VLLKVKPLLDEIIELLERRDLLATSCFIEKVGAPDERVVRDLASLKGEQGQLPVADAGPEPQAARGELRRGCRSAKDRHRSCAGCRRRSASRPA
jgi:precorrin-2/cobalt-factor-2 C20-methyltransferase